MSIPGHHPGGDEVDAIIDFLTPFIAPLIERIDADEFTTVQFVEAMQLDDDTRRAYDEALLRWHERDPELAKMVIHGQVIPQVLRRSRLVVWAGYAYGEADAYAVPAWWRKVSATD